MELFKYFISYSHSLGHGHCDVNCSEIKNGDDVMQIEKKIMKNNARLSNVVILNFQKY